ncbi:exported hypothetical protein [Candidatus Sulfopaludibacter sp. SbA4]|nr:exported hypothetical protein [Candidatus Sulfopaludibacter sp. SbA4]
MKNLAVFVCLALIPGAVIAQEVPASHSAAGLDSLPRSATRVATWIPAGTFAAAPVSIFHPIWA